MQIHQMIKNAMKDHKTKIELIQWSIMSGVSSLIYSEYIRRIKQKTTPVRSILVPEIKRVMELLETDGKFMGMLSDNMIDRISKHDMIKKYSNAPELVLFKEENIEIMKTIFDLYISPNIVRRIPETISMKFGINDPNQQLIREDRDIYLFDNNFGTSKHFNFIIDQTVLQLLLLMPTMKKSVEIPEDNARIFMSKDEILTVGNENAICPIHFNESIINNRHVMELLSFVTNTNIGRLSTTGAVMPRNNGIAQYCISTNVFNQVGVTNLEGISVD